MPNYPDRFRPFAIQLSFTSNYSLEVCAQRLEDIQIIPARWRKFLGYPYLEVDFSPVDNDLCNFWAVRNVGRNKIMAKGQLHRIDYQSTEVLGYSDTTNLWYWFLALGLVFGFFVFSRLNNGTADGLLVETVALTALVASTFFNVLLVRNKAKALAQIIENALTDA